MRPTSTHTERKEIKKKKKEETPLKERERQPQTDRGTPAMQNERDHCRLNVECLPADTIWLYSSQTDQPCLSLDRRTLPSGRQSSNKTRMVSSLLFSYLQPFSFISSFSSLSPYPVPPFVFFFFNGAPSSPKTSKILFFCFLLSLFFFQGRKTHLRHAIRRRLWFITSRCGWGSANSAPQFSSSIFIGYFDQGTRPFPDIGDPRHKMKIFETKRVWTAAVLIK